MVEKNYNLFKFIIHVNNNIIDQFSVTCKQLKAYWNIFTC